MQFKAYETYLNRDFSSLVILKMIQHILSHKSKDWGDFTLNDRIIYT